MTLSLPYVFIPGDNWENIAMSPNVSPEAGRRVVEWMRFFSNQPRFTEYLLTGGIGWLDIPFYETGVRLHYRTLARQGTRPLLYGLGLFHDSQARASAGGFVSLIATLDKILPRADLSSSFPKGGVFEAPGSSVGVTESNSLSWRDVEGQSATLAPADAYRRISTCSADEGDWRTLWKVQYDMPRIIDRTASVFFSPDFPCKDSARPAARNKPSPSPNPLPPPPHPPRIWHTILLLFTTALFLTSTVVYYRLYAKADDERRVAQEERETAQIQRANAMSDSQENRDARTTAEIARNHTKDELIALSKKYNDYVEHADEKLKEADDKERKLEEEIAELEKEVAENKSVIAELRPKADAYDRLNRLHKDTPNGNALPSTSAPAE